MDILILMEKFFHKKLHVTVDYVTVRLGDANGD